MLEDKPTQAVKEMQGVYDVARGLLYRADVLSICTRGRGYLDIYGRMHLTHVIWAFAACGR
jgi:hypothetical protein